MLACSNDRSEVVDVLLEAGADVDQHSRVSIVYGAKLNENGPCFVFSNSVTVCI